MPDIAGLAVPAWHVDVLARSKGRKKMSYNSDLDGLDMSEFADTTEEMYGFDDTDGVDLFGLDEFGQPRGLSQQWGAIIGAALQTGTALISKRAEAGSWWSKYPESVGTIAGVLGGGIMAAMRPTRAAGWTAIWVSLITGGLRQLDQSFGGAPAGWGIVEPERTYTVGNGLGIVEPYVTPTLEQPMPQIVGFGQAQEDMPQLVGVGNMDNELPTIEGAPEISGLAGHYGATVMGS